MKLDLIRGRFLRRYKRFFADVELDSGEVVVAHCPNTGSMATLLNPGVAAWISPAAPGTQRRLGYTLRMLGLPGGGLAMVDTSLPNRLVADGITAGTVPELAGYGALRREVPYGSRNSRIDLLLEPPPGARGKRARPCYIEVKNNTMASRVQAGRSDFPDSVSERGRKHLLELTDLVRDGGRAVQFYLVDRSDCDHCGIADYIDPDYASALRDAVAAGVEALAYRAFISPTEITVGERCPFTMPS